MMTPFSHWLRCLILGVSFLLPALAPAEIPPGNFPNGAMTDGTDLPDGWKVTWTGSGKLALARDTEVFQSAPASLRLSSVGGPAKGGASHRFDLQQAPCTVRGTLRTAGTIKNALVAVQILNEAGKQVGWINLAAAAGATDWKPFSAHVTLPPGARSAQLVVTLEGDGQVWLDDLTLVSEDSTTAVASKAAAAASTPAPVADAASLPVSLAATDPALRYEGRWDRRDPAGPRAAWPASAVHLRFEGAALNVRLKDTATNQYEVIVDGQVQPRLVARGGVHAYRVFEGAAGAHTLVLAKRTESFFGVVQLLGFEVSAGGRLLPAPATPSHHLEVIGDSISCGYGDEGQDPKEKFTAGTENAWLTYGALAARHFGADYTCVAWSGKKIWPDNTIGEFYDRALPADQASHWDFTSWVPDAVVINLGTNDFGRGEANAEGWQGGYLAFITRLRQHYPQAMVFCASSPMLTGEKAKTEREWLQQIVAKATAHGDPKVRYVDHAIQSWKDGLGADYHPSVKTQEIMASVLTAALEKEMGWKPAAP